MKNDNNFDKEYIENIVKEILVKENISFNKIIRTNSGFTNVAYFVDDKFVIKLVADEWKKKRLEKEVDIYNHIHLDNMASLVAHGTHSIFRYIILTKLKGKSLYSLWGSFDYKQKETIIKKIVQIIKQFNKQDYKFLDKSQKRMRWIKFWEKRYNKKVEKLKNLNVDTQKLEEIISKFKIWFKKNKYVLTYNDAHFDNFLYDNGILYLIDFDRVFYQPLDYEVMIYKLMCDDPYCLASEDMQNDIDKKDFDCCYPLFKKYFPEIFSLLYISQRIAVYMYDYYLDVAIDTNDKEIINNKINEFLENINNIKNGY